MPSSKKTYALDLIRDCKLASGANLTVIAKTVSDHIEQIEKVHSEVAQRAIIIGLTLHCIKGTLGHGKFGPFLSAHFKEKSRRQVNNYMRIAMVFANCTEVTRDELKVIQSGTELDLSNPSTAQTEIVKSLLAFVGDKTLNDLLVEHGIKDHGKLGGAREKSANGTFEIPTPEQLFLQSRDEIGGAIYQIENLLLKENRLQHMVGHPDEVRGIVESIRVLAEKVEKAVRPILKK